MKKVIVNADIMAMYKTLNSMKSRADLIAGDVDVFWANTMNLKTLKAQVDKISEVEQELVDSYFTEENSHPIVDENGNETGNRVLNDYFITDQPMTPVTPVPWKKQWIFDLADCFANGTPLHSQTWATHSCFLACDGELLFQCEDIGRHTALDKAIGYALRHNIDLKKCVVYSSGRIPTDMAIKAIRAGIPVLASKASPSAEAVAMAKEYHLTLICAARRDRMKLFTGNNPTE